MSGSAEHGSSGGGNRVLSGILGIGLIVGGVVAAVEGGAHAIITSNDGVDQAADYARAWRFGKIQHVDSSIVILGRGPCDVTDSTELTFMGTNPNSTPNADGTLPIEPFTVCMGAFQEDPTIIAPGFEDGIG